MDDLASKKLGSVGRKKAAAAGAAAGGGMESAQVAYAVGKEEGTNLSLRHERTPEGEVASIECGPNVLGILSYCGEM